MGRRAKERNAVEVKALSKVVGTHAVGGNLYLHVTSPEAQSWLFRYWWDGKDRWMGLGPYRDVTLQQAREKAADARRLLAERKDPRVVRDAARTAERLKQAHSISFEDCATRYIAVRGYDWDARKTRKVWEASLKTFVFPVFGDVPIAQVDTGLVVKALQPIWTTKAETASKVRGRIESILTWAATMQFRAADNPARWRGHLEHLLAKNAKAKRTKHLAALPFDEIATFMASVAKQPGVAADALQLTILTCLRTNEIIGANWDEIDFDAKVWVAPAARMKMRKEHRVPLSGAAEAILRSRYDATGGNGFIFPGRQGKPLSNMAMLALLERMGRDDITVHGFRSSFRDWASERTTFQREVCEAALAHAIPDKVEAAYRRGDLFGKRRKLMNAWAAYCMTPQAAGGEVVAIRRA